MSIEAAASVPPALNRTRALVEPAMREAVARLDPANRSITEYHLGWTEADGTPREGTAGKAVRPTVVMLAAQACSAGAEAALPGAVSVELVHNFSLIHDDVMDGDTERRHRPTVWALWGVPAAILTGDALLNLAQEVLLPSDSRASAALGRAVRELIRGQTEDLAFERRSWIELDECRAMAAGKTGALLSASARIGGLLGGGDEKMVDALGAYGAHVGMAFQLVDDVLGIWGDAAVTGKPVLSDLRTRKKSLPVTYVLSAGGAPARAVVDWLGSSEPEGGPAEAELERVAGVLADAGGRDWALSEAEREVEKANQALESVPMEQSVRDELMDLTRFLTARQV
ncbi:polyprenyl synthetase family protein [Kineosporia rhizophila]|uniref:polyprenyl synthetase family protein n=1 Tax=Kineosporia TaxID=49184 RepID=UPI001E5DBF7E|nr:MULTISPECIES: polyprenyl synthetase family protein [Kineosporia]MCE0539646.1 polyprenyl synthetase family protein [Kineosporia rhizophila]GLY17926.1 (2E,6E)-farnesyl diphosphate synthase [Kineosporia sp. NBRC 101677]